MMKSGLLSSFRLDKNASPMALLLIWLGILLVMLCLSMFLAKLFGQLAAPDSNAATFISITMQGLVGFAAAAYLSVSVFSKKPISFLRLTNPPTTKAILGALLIFAIASPALNYVIELNANLHLPDSMHDIETMMRKMEDAAAETTNHLLGNSSWVNMIVAILTVGIITGFGEELLFRGSLQRIIGLSASHHVAIWIAAFIFSAMHFQFFGFLPRVLLGAWFGYLLYWTRSIWVPVIVHAINNSLVVFSSWQNALPHDAGMNSELNQEIKDLVATGTSTPIIASLSLVATVLMLIYCRKWFFYPAKSSESL